MEKKFGGVLSEHGDGTAVLSDYEYRRLKSCLDLMRRAKDPQADAIASAMHEAMRRIAKRNREDSTLRVFLDCLCEELGEHVEEVVGLLLGDGEPILFRDDEQGADRVETFAALNKLFEREHWLAEFLSVTLPFWLSASFPVTPHRSP